MSLQQGPLLEYQESIQPVATQLVSLQMSLGDFTPARLQLWTTLLPTFTSLIQCTLDFTDLDSHIDRPQVFSSLLAALPHDVVLLNIIASASYDGGASMAYITEHLAKRLRRPVGFQSSCCKTLRRIRRPTTSAPSLLAA